MQRENPQTVKRQVSLSSHAIVHTNNYWRKIERKSTVYDTRSHLLIFLHMRNIKTRLILSSHRKLNVINHKNDFFSHNLICMPCEELPNTQKVWHRERMSRVKKMLCKIYEDVFSEQQKRPRRKNFNSRPSSKKLYVWERCSCVIKNVPVDSAIILFLFCFHSLNCICEIFLFAFFFWVIGVKIGIWSIFEYFFVCGF